MTEKNRDHWNSLEVTKLIVSFLTPLLIFGIGYKINNTIVESEKQKTLIESRQHAVQAFSKYIYERRSRAEMLSSALRRHAAAPKRESYDEILQRKKLYDEAFFNWNANHQANLLLVRQVLGEQEYTSFENIVETRLVLNIMKPLDDCLTRAYGATIRNGDPLIILQQCKSSDLMQMALDCGYAITDELYKLAAVAGTNDKVMAASIVDQRCPARQ